MNKLLHSYVNAGIAHAKLLLVTCLKKKALWGIKTSYQCIFCSVPCSLQNLKTEPMLVLCWGEEEGRAIERVPVPPELSQDPSLHHPSSGFL